MELNLWQTCHEIAEKSSKIVPPGAPLNPWPILCSVVMPPILARGGQGVNGIVIFVETRERSRSVGFDAGLVILGPVRDALLAVVLLQRSEEHTSELQSHVN